MQTRVSPLSRNSGHARLRAGFFLALRGSAASCRKPSACRKQSQPLAPVPGPQEGTALFSLNRGRQKESHCPKTRGATIPCWGLLASSKRSPRGAGRQRGRDVHGYCRGAGTSFHASSSVRSQGCTFSFLQVNFIFPFRN